METATKLFDDQMTWQRNVEQFALEEKYELACDWQEDEITQQEFLNQEPQSPNQHQQLTP